MGLIVPFKLIAILSRASNIWLKNSNRPWLASFHVCTKLLRKTVKRNLGKSSVEWVERHINDPYVKKSRYLNYRARSAFKLIEMDDRFKFLQAGMTVIELGAAPGSWTQVLIERLNSDKLDKLKPFGNVIAVDLLNISQLSGATTLSNCDFTHPKTKDAILKELNGSAVDIVLSDMAPNATGVREMDQDRIAQLGFETLRFAVDILKKDGSLLIKLWDGRQTESLISNLNNFFDAVKRVKPPASRSDSAELYLLCRKFKGKLLL